MSDSTSINDVAEIIRGVSYNPSQLKDQYTDGYMPIVKTNNIQDGNIEFNKLTYVESKLIKNSQLLKKGDVLIAASTGSKKIIGKAATAKKDWDGSFGAFCLVLRPDNSLINPSYFGYYFQSRNYRKAISHMSSGANINNLKREYFDRLTIPMPPLSQQDQIAKTLGKVDSIRKMRDESIKLLDELVNSYFLELFGDPITNPKGWDKLLLKDVVDIQSGQVNPKNEPYASMIHIGGADIESGSGRITKMITTSEAGQISGKYLFDNNYLLYSKIRPNLNKVALPDFSGICSADIYPIKPKAVLNKYFLAYILKSEGFLSYAIKNSGRANIPKINRLDLLNFEIVVPPINLQHDFESKWQKINDLKKAMNLQKFEIDNQFYSMMQKAFSD